jgi:hypothetical protein
MSILPEYILQQVLVRGIRAFREDDSLVRMLFRNLHQDDVDGFCEFLRDHTIDISLNFPAEPITVPSVIVALKSESESQGFLGELLQPPQSVKNTGHPFPMEEIESPATVLGGGSVENVGLTSEFIGTPIRATGSTINTLNFALIPPFNVSDPFEFDNLQIVIMEGLGAGQTRDVLSVTPNGASQSVTVRVSDWLILPDSTSIFSFKTSNEPGVTGEPSKLFTASTPVERTGSQYRVSYQLLISGPNSEITLFLYALVKAIVIIQRDYLLQNGFLNVKMSGTDFVTKPEYLPTLAYSRALILEFEHSFDVYMELEPLTRIRLQIGVFDPDVRDGSGTENIVSSTEIDV